jgi:hypothetical protein
MRFAGAARRGQIKPNQINDKLPKDTKSSHLGISLKKAPSQIKHPKPVRVVHPGQLVVSSKSRQFAEARKLGASSALICFLGGCPSSNQAIPLPEGALIWYFQAPRTQLYSNQVR